MTSMIQEEFETILDGVTNTLNSELSNGVVFQNSKDFENRVREVIREFVDSEGIEVDFNPHPHLFPDIVLGQYGVEVKFTLKDTWRSVANSILESTRNPNVVYIYVVFGKMGGNAEVRWGSYDDSVIHVRTSHVPRFEVEIDSKRRPLFEQLGIPYRVFSALSVEEKMRYIRAYARKRLKPGERFWWLEDKEEPEHSLPLEVRLYTSLSDEEKRQLRAEAALLCPQVVRPSRAKHKYDDAALYLLTYHGVISYQARDLFSAGSVAHKGDKSRGGNYVARALKDIEPEMREAALRLEGALFKEYWGEDVEPARRISEWLSRADKYATTWVPSEVLFRD